MTASAWLTAHWIFAQQVEENPQLSERIADPFKWIGLAQFLLPHVCGDARHIYSGHMVPRTADGGSACAGLIPLPSVLLRNHEN